MVIGAVLHIRFDLLFMRSSEVFSKKYSLDSLLYQAFNSNGAKDSERRDFFKLGSLLRLTHFSVET